MNIKRPGFIDPAYGNNGSAAIPPMQPVKRDLGSLQVHPAATEPDGSMAFYGFNPDDSFNERGVFTRLHANGVWDEETGHVPVSKNQTGPQLPLLYQLSTMTHGVLDGKSCFLTASGPVHVGDDSVTIHLAIGRYNATDFQPVEGFGDDGIAIIDPLPFSGHPVHGTKVKDERKNKALSSAGAPKLALIDGRIIAVCLSHFQAAEGPEQQATWCVQIDARTGEPVKGLGEKGEASQLQLPTIDGKALIPYRAHFFSDGAFLLLSYVDRKAYLHRFLPNALLDVAFAEGAGFIELPGNGTTLGLAVNDGLIVVSRSGALVPIGQPANVYSFTLNGTRDSTFEKTLSVPGHSLQLPEIAFDSADRLVLSGQGLYTVEGNLYIQSKLQLLRMTATGELDDKFGTNGYATEDYDWWGSNGLYLHENAIRILSVEPLNELEPLREYMVKFDS